MYELDKAAFGHFLAQLRREKGMTQKELAATLYVSDKAVSKWERGLSVPDISLLVPLAEQLNVTVAELLQGRRVEEEQRFTREETEDLIRKALTFSAEPPERRQARTKKYLPVFGAEYIFGVVLGCFLANLLGSTIVDVIFGTLATLLACLVTYKLRNIRFKGLALAASLPPVVFNAVIIGIEIAVMFPDPSSSAPLWLACVTNGISVGIGELISCTVLGVLLVRIIEASPAVRKVFES